MRLRESWLAAAIALSVIAAPSEARQTSAHRYVAPRTSGSDYYTNVNGHRVHRPIRANQAPAGATAKCSSVDAPTNASGNLGMIAHRSDAAICPAS